MLVNGLRVKGDGQDPRYEIVSPVYPRNELLKEGAYVDVWDPVTEALHVDVPIRQALTGTADFMTVKPATATGGEGALLPEGTPSFVPTLRSSSLDVDDSTVREVVNLNALRPAVVDFDADLVDTSRLLARVKPQLPGATTGATLRNVIREFADRPALAMEERVPSATGGGFGAFRWITWRELGRRAELLAGWLRRACYCSLAPPADLIFVGICAANSTDWFVAWVATMLCGFVAVPFHCTASKDYAGHVVGEARLRVIFCDTAARGLLQFLEDAAARGVAQLRAVVALDATGPCIDAQDGPNVGLLWAQGPPPWLHGRAASLPEILSQEGRAFDALAVVKQQLRDMVTFVAGDAAECNGGERGRVAAWQPCAVEQVDDDGVSAQCESSAHFARLLAGRGFVLRQGGSRRYEPAPTTTGEDLPLSVRLPAKRRDATLASVKASIEGLRKLRSGGQNGTEAPTIPLFWESSRSVLDEESSALVAHCALLERPVSARALAWLRLLEGQSDRQWPRVAAVLARICAVHWDAPALIREWVAGAATGSVLPSALARNRLLRATLEFASLQVRLPGCLVSTAEESQGCKRKAVGQAAVQAADTLTPVVLVARALQLARNATSLEEASAALVYGIAEQLPFDERGPWYEVGDRLEISGFEPGAVCEVVAEGVTMWQVVSHGNTDGVNGQDALQRTATQVLQSMQGAARVGLPIRTTVTVSRLGAVESGSEASERRTVVNVKSEMFGEGWVPLYLDATDGPASVSTTGLRTLAPLRLNPEDAEAFERRRPAQILYTSGSTGAPKGAIVLNETYNRTITEWARRDGGPDSEDVTGAAQVSVTPTNSTRSDDFSGVLLVKSPMSASGSLYGVLRAMVSGGRVAVIADSGRAFEALPKVRPTSVTAVPEFWRMLWRTFLVPRDRSGGTLGGEAESAEKLSYDQALTVFQRTHSSWAEVRKLFGPRLGNVNVGGALPNPEVMAWVRDVFRGSGTSVTENYGMTEVGGVGNNGGGHGGEGGGGVLSLKSDGVEVKLIDSGMYTANDKPHPRGEICVKTQRMVCGYLNRPDLTNDAFDAEGFFLTGDIGERLSETEIRIIDRKKAFFKLANGEWVSPEAVEAALCADATLGLDQVFVFGDSRGSRVVAVCVVGEAEESVAARLLATLEQREEGDVRSSASLRRRPFVVDEESLFLDFKRVGQARNLRHFEVPRVVALTRQRFTAENGLLTATSKPCRPAMRKEFEAELNAMLGRLAKVDGAAEMSVLEAVCDVVRRGCAAVLDACDGAAGSFDGTDAGLASLQGEWEELVSRQAGHMTSTFAVQVATRLGEMRNDAAGSGRGTSTSATFPVAVLLQDPPVALSSVVAFACCGVSDGLLVPVDWAAETQVDSAALWAEARQLLAASGLDVGAEARPCLLLTGATGHVGAALLERLCRDAQMGAGTALEIRCLVRCDSVESGRKRLWSVAKARGYNVAAGLLESREVVGSTLSGEGRHDGMIAVKIVPGDFAAKRLGLATADFVRLAASTEAVLHCGATVNHLAGYRQLHAANAGSVLELVRLCCVRAQVAPSAAPVRFLLVSTRSAGPADVKPVQRGGYGQSKWVGEQRLRNAAGGLEASITPTVIQLGMVGWDGETGAANADDWIMRYVRGACQLGMSYAQPGAVIDLIPVDKAAAVIARCLDCIGAGSATPPPGVPAAADEEAQGRLAKEVVKMDCLALLRQVQEAGQTLGLAREVRCVSAEVWAETMSVLSDSNPMFPLRHRYADGLGSVPAPSTSAGGGAALAPAFFSYKQSAVEDCLRYLAECGLLEAHQARGQLLARTFST